MTLEGNKRLLPALALLAAAAPMLAWSAAKPASADVPVWLTMYTRTFPGKLDDYVGQMKLFLLPVLEEDKRQGGLLDYKVLRKINGRGADDWNVELIVIFKNHAGMDGYRARWNAIAKKLEGDKEEPDRSQMRIDEGADLFEEIH